MAEIINLKSVRKEKIKQADKKRAESNRLHYGTPLGERKKIEAEKKRSQQKLDGHLLQTSDEE